MVNYFLQQKPLSSYHMSDLSPPLLIKEGGQSQIFAAILRKGDKNQPVVIKVYGNDPHSWQSFSIENRVLSHTRHPAIIELLGLLEHPDGPALVLKRASKVSLAQIIELAQVDGSIPQVAIRYVFRHLLAGLKHLHTGLCCHLFPFGVIHGDISSQNVIFSPQGRCILIDLGAAVDRPLTPLPAVFGKQRYLAPEQHFGYFSCWSDLYSWGAVMFELSLLRPFDPMRTARDFLDLKQRLAKSGSDMFLAIRACLAPSVSNRPRSAALILENCKKLFPTERKDAKNFFKNLIRNFCRQNR